MTNLLRLKRTAGITAISLAILASSIAAVPFQEATPGSEAPDVEVIDAEDSEIVRRGYAGVVVSLADGSLVIERRGDRGNSPEIAITPETEIRMPGAEDVKGELAIDARVAVLAEQVGEDEWAAVQVVVIPTGPSIRPVTGVVVSVADGVLTIALPNGETRMIELGPKAEVPEEGEVITAFEDRRGSRPTVTGIAKADDVRARLQRFLSRAETDPNRGAEARDRVLARLGDLLDRHSARNVEILQGLIDGDRLPEQARTRVQSALQRAQDARGNVESRIDRIRARFENVGAILDNLRAGRNDGAGRPADAGTGSSRPSGERPARPTARSGR